MAGAAGAKEEVQREGGGRGGKLTDSQEEMKGRKEAKRRYGKKKVLTQRKTRSADK